MVFVVCGFFVKRIPSFEIYVLKYVWIKRYALKDLLLKIWVQGLGGWKSNTIVHELITDGWFMDI